jgi:hypothetical protein
MARDSLVGILRNLLIKCSTHAYKNKHGEGVVFLSLSI